jgi:hypothetical protein
MQMRARPRAYGIVPRRRSQILPRVYRKIDMGLAGLPDVPPSPGTLVKPFNFAPRPSRAAPGQPEEAAPRTPRGTLALPGLRAGSGPHDRPRSPASSSELAGNSLPAGGPARVESAGSQTASPSSRVASADSRASGAAKFDARLQQILAGVETARAMITQAPVAAAPRQDLPAPPESTSDATRSPRSAARLHAQTSGSSPRARTPQRPAPSPRGTNPHLGDYAPATESSALAAREAAALPLAEAARPPPSPGRLTIQAFVSNRPLPSPSAAAGADEAQLAAALSTASDADVLPDGQRTAGGGIIGGARVEVRAGCSYRQVTEQTLSVEALLPFLSQREREGLERALQHDALSGPRDQPFLLAPAEPGERLPAPLSPLPPPLTHADRCGLGTRWLPAAPGSQVRSRAAVRSGADGRAVLAHATCRSSRPRRGPPARSHRATSIRPACDSQASRGRQFSTYARTRSTRAASAEACE